MSEKVKSKITFHKVWKGTKPYITIPQTKLKSSIALKLGFGTFEKKKYDEQYFKVAPKTDKGWAVLKKKLSKKGYVARIKQASDSKVEELGWKYFDGYEFGLKRNVQAEKFSKEFIKKEKSHSSLVGCSIGHFFKSQDAPYDEETGRMTFAFASLASTMHEKFAHFDFIIYYYEDAWDCCVNIEREMLVDHELFHCGVDGIPYIRDHDIQEFKYIVGKYDLQPPSYHWATRGMKKLLSQREEEE